MLYPLSYEGGASALRGALFLIGVGGAGCEAIGVPVGVSNSPGAAGS